MKYAIKLGKLIRGSKGQATISAAMILLVIGGILIPPCLGYAVASLKASQSGEQVLEGRYAADSGVEAAIDQINHNSTSVANFSLNDRNVSVNVTQIKKGTYKIISTATSDSGGNTTIECYYGALDYSSLLDSAITSDTGVTIKKGVNVTGNISTPDCSVVFGCNNCTGCPNNWTCCVDCPNCTTCCSQEPVSWPTAEELSAYYWDQVKNLEPPFPYTDPLNIAGTNTTIEALYREYKDAFWEIHNQGDPATLTLNGTVYVTDDLVIGTVKNDFTLNLNNQTIFVESASADPQKAIEVGGKCTITGSGCIIAVGDVYFAPKGDVGSLDNFVLIMSVEGTVTLQPSGTFYGAIAGKVEVEEKSGFNASITWTSYEGKGIDFPIGQGMMKVFSYTIK